MKLVQNILVNNPCYTAGRKITVKGLMLHSIGCPQPDANVFLKNWNSSNHKNSCVHAFIDGNDGTVYQTLPWNRRGWHCASGKKGSGNNTHIGVEMCEPPCIKYTKGSSFTCSDVDLAKAVVKRTYTSAVELFAMLCKQFNLDPLEDGVIIGHAEGYKRGIASNHGDPEHLWKGLGLGYTMDGFRQDVKNAIAPAQSTTSTKLHRVQVGAYANKDNAVKGYWDVVNAGFSAIMIKAGGLYKIQVGAYEKKSNAETMKKNLEKAGFKTCITTKAGTSVKVEYTQAQFVRDVQTALGVKVTGKADQKTLDATITISAFINHKHKVVRFIQRRLNALGYDCGEADGAAGKKFAKAVEKLQRAIGANVDGEITRLNKTWRYLLGVL